MITTVTRRYHFSASHRLHVPSLSETRNAELYGKCNNPYGHGHNYVLDVTVEGPVDATTGKLFRFGELDRLVEAEILARFDHRNLNLDLPEFREVVPTTENICLVISGLLLKSWSGTMPANTRLARIYIEETGRNTFEVLLPLPHSPSLSGREPVEETIVAHA